MSLLKNWISVKINAIHKCKTNVCDFFMFFFHQKAAEILAHRHTVQKVIGNILSPLKSASLKIKNTISSLGIFLRLTACFFTSLTATKYSNQSDGWKSSDIWWKTAPIFFDGNCRHFVGKFWCQLKKFSSPPYPLTGRQSPFWKRTGHYSTVNWR